MASCHSCLAAVATGWEGTPWDAAAVVACWVHTAAPPDLHVSWIQGSSKCVLQRLVAAGAGSGTPHGPLPSCAAAVGGTGVVLTFCSPAPAHRQNRGAKIVNLTGKGRRSRRCRRECFLSEHKGLQHKGLPRVLRLCFKQERAFKARPLVSCSVNVKVLYECISHHPRAAEGGGKGDLFPCGIKNNRARGTGTAADTHMERHRESPI